MSASSASTSKHGPITGLQLQRGLRVNIMAGALGVSWWSMTQGMPLTMFFEALGASGLMMGLVTTIMQFAFLMQVPATIFAERLAARKPTWGAVCLVHRALWFLPALFMYLFPDRLQTVAMLTMVLLAVSSLLGQSVTAMWFSWMADLVPESMRGRFWGKRQSWLMAASLISMAVAGYVLDLFPAPHHGQGTWRGFALIFVIGAFVGCADIIIHLWVPEPLAQKKRQTTPWFSKILDPLKDRDFRNLTLAMGLFSFSVGLVSLGMVYLKKDFHVTYMHLSAITISASIGSMLFGIVSGYAMDRIGGRTFGAIMIAFAPVLGLGWFFVKGYPTDLVSLAQKVPLIGQVAGSAAALLPARAEAWLRSLEMPQAVWIQVFVALFAGAFYGSIGICQYHMSAAIVPREGRTMSMAVHWSLAGLIGAFGSMCAGHVMDYFAAHPLRYTLPSGTPLAFHHVLVVLHVLSMWLIVLPLLLKVRPRKGELPVGIAVSRLLVANPFRAVANIYSIGAPLTRGRRARAVRSLGRERTGIAVTDLIEKLDDPSTDVREEAVYALGSIGSPEAISALVAKLDDPQSDLAPQIAKALRTARDPKSVEALLRKLDDPDRETKTESARALGEIGDRRAVPLLMELLSKSKDAKVVSASSDALARLGELAALYEILPRMRQTRNPVLKRSLAVAVGDLLGERDGFYKVLSIEQQTAGVEVDRMIRELRHAIADVTRERMTSPGRSLHERAARVQQLYEEGRFSDCVAEMFALAIGLAALRWGVEFGGDALAAIHHLIWRDQRFGVGVWYLDYLREGFGDAEATEPDAVDALLGVYFLYCQGLERKD